LGPVLGLQCRNSSETSLTKIRSCKRNLALCPKSGYCLSTLSQNSLSVCDVNLRLNVESDVKSMNWSSSAELKPVGVGALKGSLTQSYWELFSWKYFLKNPINNEICSLICGITEVPELVQNSLYKSQSAEDCAHVRLLPEITIYGDYNA